MENNNINNETNYKNEILEIEIGPDGEFTEETTKFIKKPQIFKYFHLWESNMTKQSLDIFTLETV